jgi:hypothetical protein
MSEIGTAAIRRAALKYGGAVQVDGQTLYVDAPRGSIWKARASGNHLFYRTRLSAPLSHTTRNCGRRKRKAT